MSGRFVRASKYRHVFGRSTKKEQCYDNLRISNNAWDTNLVKVNSSYLAVNWQASGGGAFAVIPLSERGRVPEQLPLFRGHTAAVLDTDWNPFDDSSIASGSDDGKVLLWKVPEDFSVHRDPEAIEDVKPVGKLAGHSRKVGHVLFNPSAEGILASSSGDYTVKIWDVESGAAKHTLKHNDIVQSLSWSANGSMLVTTCRDKKLRIWDTRQQKPAIETAGHSGAKNSRAVWMGERDRIATTGFSKMSDRQLGLWDARVGREPIEGFMMLDQISGVCMPFWDDGTQCLYLAGKGDGNIRYYEYENDKFEFLSQHSSPDPQRGVAFMPKRGINTRENEVARAYRTVNDTLIEPVPFIVPRRAEVFQEDIYPPTVGSKPGLSAADWFAGKDALPPKISLESAYEGQVPEEVPGDYKPPEPAKAEPTKTDAPPKKALEPAREPEPQPAATISRGPPSSIKDNQTSMSTMASKFADKPESESSSDETSSFEEVPKPIERPAATSQAPKTNGDVKEIPVSRTTSATEPDPRPVTEVRTPPITSDEPPAAILPSSTQSGATASAQPGHRSTSSTGAATENLKSHLRDIKGMLEVQQKTITAQNEKLELLTKEVERLRKGSGTSSDGTKDERIRMLELELEQATS